MKILSQPFKFLSEVRAELRAVEWVTRKQLVNYTLIVVTFTVGLTVFVYVVDALLVALRSAILITNTI